MFFRQLAFRFFGLAERFFAYMLGKGYGSATIRREVKSVISRLTTVPLLAIDVGGNVGLYSKELRSKFPDLEIHIFEPSILNVAKLQSDFQSDKKIHINSVGLSDRNSEANLYSDVSGSGMGSLVNRRLDHFKIKFSSVEKIKTIRFDGYWEKSLAGRVIDIVKLDIEGVELEALMGFGLALLKTKVVQFEFGGCNLDTRTNFQDFYYFFNTLLFKLYRVTPLGLQPIEKYQELDEVFITTNFLAVNSRIL